MDLDLMVQSGVTIGSIISSGLVSSDKPWRKWGYLAGLSIQPLWFYTIIHNQQWALLPLTCWFTATWTFGTYNFIIKPRRERIHEATVGGS